MWRRLNELARLRGAADGIASALSALSRPRLSDPALMGRVTAAVDGYCAGRGMSRSDRCLLSCACLLALYAPSALAGDRLRGKMRARIARSLGVWPDYVSQQKGRILYLYNHDSRLRGDLEALAPLIGAALQTTGATMIHHTSTLYIARDADGTPSLFTTRPERDAHGFWAPTQGGEAFPATAGGCPVYGLLLPWLERAGAADALPLRVELSAEGCASPQGQKAD